MSEINMDQFELAARMTHEEAMQENLNDIIQNMSQFAVVADMLAKEEGQDEV